jgi:hypothetical protein
LPEYMCFCGAGYYLSSKNHKSLVEDSQGFCSVDCFLRFVESLPRVSPLQEECVLNPFVSAPFEVWDAVTGRFYRSWYEVHVARCLANGHIEFEYESKCIFIGNGHYSPDFYLTQYGLYIEVKGYWGLSAKTKFRTAIKMGYNLVLLPWHLAKGFRKLYRLKNESDSIVR